MIGGMEKIKKVKDTWHYTFTVKSKYSTGVCPGACLSWENTHER
jgi:hypothetical protein